MNAAINNNRGFAIVYALVTLVLASVGGTALLFMTQKDHVSQSDYSGMRTASQAAVVSLKACEGQFLNDPATALNILKEYKNNNANKWLLGAGPTTSELKIKLWDGSDSPEYSARIVDFDDASSTVIIEGTGYLPNGGRKRVLASYRLEGLEMVAITKPSYSLFLGGALMNLNCPFNINGDVYISLTGSTTEQHINNSGGTINGNLKVRNSASNFLDINSAVTITGNALILSEIRVQGNITVNGKAGFTNDFVNFSKTMYLKDDAYFLTPNFGYTNCIEGLASKKAYYKSGISSDRFKNFITEETTMSESEVAAALGTTSSDEEPYSVDISVIPSGMIKSVSQAQVYASDVETWWTQQSNATPSKLFAGEWLVVKLGCGMEMKGGYFTKKVIFLTNGNSINVNGNWYDCANGSNTMIYVTGGGSISGMGVPTNKNFRGLVYANTTSSNCTYQFGSGSTVYGAILHKQGTFDMNNGVFTLDCSDGSLGQSALQELADIGVFKPSATSTFPPELTLVDKKIRPMMLSMQL